MVIPSHIQILLDTIIMELGHIAQIKADLPTAAPNQLLTYSIEAYQHMFKEIEILAEDRKAGMLISKAERYLHEKRADKWRMLLNKILTEIDNRGQEVRHQLINQLLNSNSPYSQN